MLFAFLPIKLTNFMEMVRGSFEFLENNNLNNLEKYLNLIYFIMVSLSKKIYIISTVVLKNLWPQRNPKQYPKTIILAL